RVRIHFISYAIAEVGAAEEEAGPGPFSTHRMPDAEEQQSNKGDARPDRKKGVRHEKDMPGDAVVAKRLEPTGTIGIEGVDKDVDEKLQAKEGPPVPAGHTTSRVD